MSEKLLLTISRHDLNQDSHLDIFIEQTEYLETYGSDISFYNSLLEGKVLEVTKKNPHRKIYLDYSGIISEKKGLIQILWKGFCILEKTNFPKKMYMQKIEDTLIRFY